MDRRSALKLMGLSLATAAMASVAPKTHAAILKDRAKAKKRLVFYFTATGNSLFIAKQFSDEPLSIPQELKKGKQTYEADEIGFVFPDYTASAPMIVREFLQKNSFKATYMFTIVTYGAHHVEVCAWWDRFAKEHGVTFQYIRPILMVDNFLPTFDMNEQMKMDKHVDESLAVLLEEVGARKQFIEPSDLGFFANNPEMLEQRRNSRFSNTADQLFELRADRCVECMTCERVCPHKNFSLTGEGVRFGGRCEFCLACVHNCPQKALTLKPGNPGRPGERNPEARYRNPNVSLMDIIRSNRQ